MHGALLYCRSNFAISFLHVPLVVLPLGDHSDSMALIFQPRTQGLVALFLCVFTCFTIRTRAIPCNCPLEDKLLYGVQNARKTANKIWCVLLHICGYRFTMFVLIVLIAR